MKTPDSIYRQRSCRPDRERGVSVVIAMVLLIMLTSLGVAALRISSVDELMTGNLQQEVTAFQGAETGLSIAWSTSDSITTQDTQGSANDSVRYICTGGGNCNASTDGRYKTKITINSWYVGEGNTAPTGYSMESGMATHYYGMKSIGNHSEKTSEVGTGFYRIGPSSRK